MSTTTTTTKSTTTPNGAKDKPAEGPAPTAAENFAAQIERRFIAETSTQAAWTPHQKRLAQHLYIKVDAALKAFEAKRTGDKAPYVWENINMTKLAIDAVHRIQLGLDALLRNYIHVVPYSDGRLKKYGLDLRIGYEGQDFIHRRLALNPIVDIRYELVYSSDEFSAIVKSGIDQLETYSFRIHNPFDRGNVLGGFGYIQYEDPRQNKLVLVTPRDFEKAKSGAQTMDFWDPKKWDLEMQKKTVVLRTCAQIPLDPVKVNDSGYALIEAEEIEVAEFEIAAEAAAKANAEPLALDQQAQPEPEVKASKLDF